MNDLKDKPFALIGVNIVGSDATKLKGVMDKSNLTWRSFADPGEIGQGSIATQWNLSATPTLYILDPKGIIRHKWLSAPGEKTLDAALDRLIDEAENTGK